MSEILRRIVYATVCFVAGTSICRSADKPWSMGGERYCCFMSGMTLQELASGGVTVLSHVPATRQFCKEARRWGIKACPYVSLYKVIDSTKAGSGDENDRGAHLCGEPFLSSPFWKEVDASKHPEWFLRREDGGIRRPFNMAEYPAAFEQSCCNHRSLMAAYERGVRNVMELGAGGVFIDNVNPYPKCFGHELGLHAHDWPDKNNVECFKMALRRVCNAVKSYGKDRVVIINPGYPRDYHPYFGDCTLWESFVWRSPAADDGAPLTAARRVEPLTWERLLALRPRWRPLGEQGPPLAPLTYLPDPETEAQNAFFAYAMARLAGFDQWTAVCLKRRDILRRLYRVDTGPAISEAVEVDGAVYRSFQKALIVCNPSKQTVEVRIAPPLGLGAEPVDLFEVRKTPLSEGRIAISLPPESGRVVVPRADALDNLLREVEGQTLAALLYFQKKNGDGDGPIEAVLQNRLQDIRGQATELRKIVGKAAAPVDLDALEALSKLAATVENPSLRDPFLAERLDNLRRHAGLAASLKMNY